MDETEKIGSAWQRSVRGLSRRTELGKPRTASPRESPRVSPVPSRPRGHGLVACDHRATFLAQGDKNNAQRNRTQAQPEHDLIAGDGNLSIQPWERRQDRSADLLIDGATEPEKEIEDPHRGGDDLRRQ